MDALEKRIDCGPAPLWFLVRSRRVLAMSPPRIAHVSLNQDGAAVPPTLDRQ